MSTNFIIASKTTDTAEMNEGQSRRNEHKTLNARYANKFVFKWSENLCYSERTKNRPWIKWKWHMDMLNGRWIHLSFILLWCHMYSATFNRLIYNWLIFGEIEFLRNAIVLFFMFAERDEVRWLFSGNLYLLPYGVPYNKDSFHSLCWLFW